MAGAVAVVTVVIVVEDGLVGVVDVGKVLLAEVVGRTVVGDKVEVLVVVGATSV